MYCTHQSPLSVLPRPCISQSVNASMRPRLCFRPMCPRYLQYLLMIFAKLLPLVHLGIKMNWLGFGVNSQRSISHFRGGGVDHSTVEWRFLVKLTMVVSMSYPYYIHINSYAYSPLKMTVYYSLSILHRPQNIHWIESNRNNFPRIDQHYQPVFQPGGGWRQKGQQASKLETTESRRPYPDQLNAITPTSSAR